VIKVEFVSCATESAFASISFPYVKFNGCGDESPSLCIYMSWLCEVFIPFDGYEFELIHNTVHILFLPCIDEVKYAVV